MSKLIKTSEDLTALNKVEADKYELDYDTIKKDTEVKIELEFMPELSMTKFFVKPSCGGCTKAKATYVKEDKAGIFIEYDTKLLGRINKYVYLFYEDKDRKSYKIEIKLTGKIE